MKKDEILYETKWLLLKQLKIDSAISYIYSHEKRCNGHIVAILPYRKNIIDVKTFSNATDPDVFQSNDEKYFFKYEYLLRSEFTPCWSTEKNCISSITGGVENLGFGDNNVKVSACKELMEEAGYELIHQESLINLGTCFGTKSTDTVYHLFSVDLTGKENKWVKRWSKEKGESLVSKALISNTNIKEIPKTLELFRGKGDGSKLEEKAYCFWTDKIDEAVDPLIYIMYYRLQERLK